MKTLEININGKTATGIEILLPGAPLVLATGKEGFVMCGYLNIEAANKLGVAAAIVRGVNTVNDLLAGSVSAVSAVAEQKGVKLGDTGQQALSKLV